MVEGVAHAALDDAGGLGARKSVFGLALKLGVADEDREHGGGGAERIVGRHLADALVAGKLAIAAQALGHRRTKARFMRAAVRGGHRVTLRATKADVADDLGRT